MRDSGIVVLGAGLAGMAAGMRAAAPVYEAASQAGGVAASDTTAGFTFDRGIHVLQTRNERILALFDELGVRLGERERNAHIYSHGVYTAYPFQINTAGLPLVLRARCLAGFFLRDRRSEPTNYEEWMYASLGRGFAETFLIPYSEKFWTVHPRELTHDWTGNRVPTPSALQVLRGAVWNRQTRIGANATFRYPQMGAGYGAVATALAARVPAIHLDHRAVAIDPITRRVEFANGRSVHYSTLISTVPLNELVSITAGAPSEVRAAAARLRTNSIMLVNLGIARPDVSDKHWVHFPGRDVSFFRLSYPHNFDQTVAPPGMSAISVEVAYTPQAPPEPEALVQRVIRDLVRVGAMRADEPIVMTTTYDIRLAYCIFDQQREAAVKCIADWLATRDIITCGRYGLWTYFWSDEAMVSGLDGADVALARLGTSRSAIAVGGRVAAPVTESRMSHP